MEILKIVEQVGSYAGFAAVIGLAVLSALYFSQARDVRRLREWAGRSPEGMAQQSRVVSAPQRGAGAQRDAGAQRAGGAQGGATQQRSAGGQPAAPARASSASAVPPPISGAGQPGSSGGNGGPGRPSISTPTQVWSPAPSSGPSFSRRLPLRYVVLIVAGVLVVGGGAAFGVIEWYSSGGGSAAGAPSPPPEPAAVTPSQVTVSVLNGTTASGLAADVGEDIEQAGFQLGNVTNASDQNQTESAILYVDGAEAEARVVSSRLGVSQTERASPGDQALAGDARVIIVVGADMQ